MCGRYTLRASPKVVAKVFGLADEPELFPRFNIAPTQPAPLHRITPSPWVFRLVR